MKKLILYIGLLLANFAIAQNTTPCASTWLPASGTLLGTNPLYNGTFAGQYKSTCNATEENPLWYKFVAKDNSVKFTVDTKNCKGGTSAQKGLTYAIFQERTPNCLDLRPTANCLKTQDNDANVVFNTTLVANRLYYLQIDGLAGSQCDFKVNYDVAQLATSLATLRGNVFWDKNFDCKKDANDVLLKDALVVIKKSAADSVFAGVREDGSYEVLLPLGTYQTYALVGGEKRLWKPCSLGTSVALTTPNTWVQQDFLFQSQTTCAIMEADITTNSFIQNEKSVLKVKYKNIGTLKANNAKAKITLDPALTLLSVSKAYTQTNNTLVVNLGDVEAQTESNFEIFVKSPSTNFTTLQAVSNKIEIIPNNFCFPTPGWNGADLQVFATCAKDSVRFGVKNLGTGLTPINGIIIEDDVMVLTKKNFNTISPNDSVALVALPATGKTYRLEVDQSINFPQRSMPSVTVEKCRKGNTGTFTVGYSNMYAQDDAAFYRDIDLREVESAGSYPSKLAFPKGYLKNDGKRYIAQNQDIEYIIRFQNKDLQTIQNLYIVDTLSEWMDVSSLRIGASNFPMNVEVSGTNLLQFKFPDLQLFGEQVNKDSSELFVKYRISQKKDVPLGKTIVTRAAIFKNAEVQPLITEEIRHTIGSNFIKLSVASQEVFEKGVAVSVVPNPFSETAQIILSGVEPNANLILQIIDLQGSIIQKQQTQGGIFDLQKNNLTQGMYFYRIQNERKVIATGKIVVE
jgi:Secretion system C-terminal sorting domain